MSSIKNKIEEVIDFVENKINDECSTSYCDYCRLDLYNRHKKQATQKDFDNDCYFYIVDLASRLTLGTIYASCDEENHYWIMVNSIIVDNSKKTNLQSRIFNEIIDKVVQLSDLEFTIQESGYIRNLSKAQNIVKRVQFVEITKTTILTIMLASISITYWLPIIIYGFSLPLIMFPVFNLLFFCMMFAHDDSY